MIFCGVKFHIFRSLMLSIKFMFCRSFHDFRFYLWPHLKWSLQTENIANFKLYGFWLVELCDVKLNLTSCYIISYETRADYPQRWLRYYQSCSLWCQTNLFGIIWIKCPFNISPFLQGQMQFIFNLSKRELLHIFIKERPRIKDTTQLIYWWFVY